MERSDDTDEGTVVVVAELEVIRAGFDSDDSMTNVLNSVSTNDSMRTTSVSSTNDDRVNVSMSDDGNNSARLPYSLSIPKIENVSISIWTAASERPARALRCPTRNPSSTTTCCSYCSSHWTCVVGVSSCVEWENTSRKSRSRSVSAFEDGNRSPVAES